MRNKRYDSLTPESKNRFAFMSNLKTVIKAMYKDREDRNEKKFLYRLAVSIFDKAKEKLVGSNPNNIFDNNLLVIILAHAQNLICESQNDTDSKERRELKKYYTLEEIKEFVEQSFSFDLTKEIYLDFCRVVLGHLQNLQAVNKLDQTIKLQKALENKCKNYTDPRILETDKIKPTLELMFTIVNSWIMENEIKEGEEYKIVNSAYEVSVIVNDKKQKIIPPMPKYYYSMLEIGLDMVELLNKQATKIEAQQQRHSIIKPKTAPLRSDTNESDSSPNVSMNFFNQEKPNTYGDSENANTSFNLS